MRINKVKGFTLIELLAVIVILAIIALISTPIIIGVIENAQDKAKMNSALGLVGSVDNYYASGIINPESYPINPTTNILNSISYTGERPEAYTTTGYGVYLNSNKEIAIAVAYNGTCYQKGYKDTTIRTFPYDPATCVALAKTEPVLNGSDPSYEKGLIPIVYDENVASPTYRKWVKADVYSTTNTWYNYATRKWANAVMVTDATRATYVASSPGTEVIEADILGYLVWVPRYEYKFTGMAEANAIPINFISKTTTIASDAGNYKVHPAFTFGDEQLNGIWVGKFEVTGTTSTPTIKPNVTSLRYEDVSTYSETSQKFNTYGLGTSNNAHMMKDSEWGAVAYLSHSVYGNCSNSTTCIEIYTNNSNNYLTGRSGGAASGATPTVAAQYPASGSTVTNIYYEYGYYTYDGKIVEYGGATNVYAPDITLGTKASTTGNIYGIYDMVGNTYEYVTDAYSNITNNNGYPGYSGYDTSLHSGYNGWLGNVSSLKTDGKSWPASKYYDLFTSTTVAAACNGGVCYGHALSETTNWYADYAGFITTSLPWTIRGGYYKNAVVGGIFLFYNGNGTGYVNLSTRITVSSSI